MFMIPGSKLFWVLTVLSALSVLMSFGEVKAEQGFQSHSSATIKDMETDLEWAVDAGMPSFKGCVGGKKTWPEAAAYVKCLNAHKYHGHSDWRLPNTFELSHLVYKLSRRHALKIAGPKLKEMQVKNIQSSLYWSSASMSDGVAMAVEVLTDGESHPMGTSNRLNVWPVRGGKSGSK